MILRLPCPRVHADTSVIGIITSSKEGRVRAKSLFIMVLMVILMMATMLVGACGADDSEAKAALSAALDKVDAAMVNFQKMDQNSTVADIKAAKVEMEPIWTEVVEASKGVKDADPAAAEKVWTDLAAAVDGLSDDANIMEAATAIMGPVQALMAVQQELRTLVTPK